MPINTGNTSREFMGTGSIINPNHEGGATNRRDRLENVLGNVTSKDIVGGGKTPDDLRREREARESKERELARSKKKIEFKGKWIPIASEEEGMM